MNLHETAMGQRFFNVQLPTLINTLKDIAAALSRPAPSAISFPADQHFLTSLYYGEYEADVFKPDKRLSPFNQAVQQKEKALLPLLSNEASIASATLITVAGGVQMGFPPPCPSGSRRLTLLMAANSSSRRKVPHSKLPSSMQMVQRSSASIGVKRTWQPS